MTKQKVPVEVKLDLTMEEVAYLVDLVYTYSQPARRILVDFDLITTRKAVFFWYGDKDDDYESFFLD